MAESAQNAFAAADYAAFIVLLTVPSFIGLYFAWKDRKYSTTSRYFFGEKRMHPVAVGISTAVTSISALTMIAYPAEVYLVGIVYFWAPLAIIAAATITMIYYVPFYGRLQLDTIYGYLELRFNASVRRVVAGMVTVSEIFYMGIIIYLPAIALSAVAPISVNWSCVVIGGICTFYTTLGGMQAVVWTDIVQSVFMIFATVMLLINSTITIGGLGAVWEALERGNRTMFFQFDDFDISSRVHPIAISVGEFFVFTNYLGFAQPIYQRILSCKSTRQSQYSIIAYAVPAIIIICISICNGLVMYAYFEGCDPVKNGTIEKRDQGIPYMALKEFSNLPGMSGVFVAAVFSGTLSTVSSGLNAYAAVLVEDFFSIPFPKLSQKKKVLLGKVSATVLGALVVLFSYVISIMGQNALKILRCLAGAIGGSVLGIFLLGIFIPWANSTGAIVGGSTAYITMVWIFVGSKFFLTAPSRVQIPPISISDCPVANVTTFNSTITPVIVETYSPYTASSTTVGPNDDAYSFDQVLYSLNFHYYVLVGCMLTIIVGVIVSLISGRNRPADANPKLFLPIFDNPCLPEKFREFFRCGVPVEKVASGPCDRSIRDDVEMKPLTA